MIFVFIFSGFLQAERLPIKTYTVADGLLRDNVYRIRQDSRGFLWFCTAEGISRFDGYAFKNFTTADGLPERHANDFLETKNGTIYIATDGGLARLNPTGLAASKDNPLFSVTLPDNPKAKLFQVLFEDESGQIWAGTSDGLYKLTDVGDLAAVDLGDASDIVTEITSIIKDRRGALWIGTLGKGLYRILQNGATEHFTTENGLPDVNISAMREDKNGRIWVGLRPHFASGLLLLAAEPNAGQNIVERHYTTKDGLPANWITSLFETGDGDFLIGTTGGLCLWQTGKDSVCKTYAPENELSATEIWSILEDREKNLWLGTRYGLKKWARYGFTAYTEANGTTNRMPNSIFENAADELFVSYNDGLIRTVSRFGGENFQIVKPNFPPITIYFGWGWKQTVWQDRTAGDWWLPFNGGLFRFPQPAKFEDLAMITPQIVTVGAKPSEIFRFYEDSRGDFWISVIGTVYELWRWERNGDVWHDYTRELGIEKNRVVSAFVEDKSGNLWIGTGTDTDNAALIRYRDGRFTSFPQSENKLLADWMRDLYVDGKNRLWIGDTATGVLRLDDVNAEQLSFKQYTPAEGLSSIGVSCITEDAFGRIYIGTGRGLDRLNADTGQVENFATADGLPNSNVETAYRDRQNNLWFGTTSGLARFVPEPPRQRQPPNILITGLRVSGVPQAVSVLGETATAPLDLSSDQQQITVDFLGLATNLGEHLKYEYRFENTDWTPANERSVNFANLAAGEYKFEVRAQTADRIYSSPATVSFKIAAPLWRRWWFIAAILLLTALTIYLFYKNRLARLLEMERMRTRIATDLHDDIGANLTRISLLSEVANQQAVNGSVKKLLPSIAEIARESVASMNDIVWAIAPEHDSLLDLTRRMRQHAEEVFSYREIDLSFNATDADLKLSVGVRRDVLLIFKESVNNAAKHSDCTKVEIDFNLHGANLNLRIADNGKGFDSNENYDGQGLRSMTRRARALGGNLQIESSKLHGTIIEFNLPLPKISRV
ncbi:MAG: histidine kinase [Pyrinomonadaceae bacterium]|nr:histidine kinase [Pyrinomonadaceae bacterium]